MSSASGFSDSNDFVQPDEGVIVQSQQRSSVPKLPKLQPRELDADSSDSDHYEDEDNEGDESEQDPHDNLRDHRVYIRRIKDRYQEQDGEINERALRDIGEVCDLALKLNDHMVSLAKQVEELADDNQDIEQRCYDAENKLRELQERTTSEAKQWKQERSRLLEEIDQKDNELDELRHTCATSHSKESLPGEQNGSMDMWRQDQRDTELWEQERNRLQQGFAEELSMIQTSHANRVDDLERQLNQIHDLEQDLRGQLVEALRARDNSDYDHQRLREAHEALQRKYESMSDKQNELVAQLMEFTSASDPALDEKPRPKLSLQDAVEMLIEHAKRNFAIVGLQGHSAVTQPRNWDHQRSVQDVSIEADRLEPQLVIKEIEVLKEVPVEVIREVEVPVEVIREVEVPVEVIREVEVPVEVIREVEIVKEMPVEVIREVQVPVEVIKEVPVIKEVLVEVIKEVPVDAGKEVEKSMDITVEGSTKFDETALLERLAKLGTVHVHFHSQQHQHSHSHHHAHTHVHNYGGTVKPAVIMSPAEAANVPEWTPMKSDILSVANVQKVGIRHRQAA